MAYLNARHRATVGGDPGGLCTVSRHCQQQVIVFYSTHKIVHTLRQQPGERVNLPLRSCFFFFSYFLLFFGLLMPCGLCDLISDSGNRRIIEGGTRFFTIKEFQCRQLSIALHLWLGLIGIIN